MIENAVNRSDVSRPRHDGIPEVPTQGHAQRFVEFGLLLRRDWHSFETRDQPCWCVLLFPASRLQPTSPRRVSLDIGIVFEQGDKSRASGAQLSSRLVILPGNFDFAWHALDEPARNIKAKSIFHLRAGDSGDFEGVELVHVSASFTQRFYFLVEIIQKALGEANHSWSLGKCAEEKERFVEANQPSRIGE